MSKKNFHLLPRLLLDIALARFGDVVGNLASIFMLFTGDLARIGVRTAFGFKWAGLADLFQGAKTGRASAGWTSVRIGVVAKELLQRMTFRADVLIVLGIPLEVGTGPGSV